MLGFLHTAGVHVETFERLVRELDGRIPTRHAVRQAVLAETRAAGKVTDQVRAAIAEAVADLADSGATVVVCTCSTIAPVAEACSGPGRVRVMRIDRPMAERAVRRGSRILVLAALRSTLPATLELLRESALAAGRSVELVEIVCEHAWHIFERGDQAGYAAAVADTIEMAARPGDVIVLAQASMAPAADLVAHLGVPILSSPRLGVQAAITLYRALALQARPSQAREPSR